MEDSEIRLAQVEERLLALEHAVRPLARLMEELEVRLARRLVELEKGGLNDLHNRSKAK